MFILCACVCVYVENTAMASSIKMICPPVCVCVCACVYHIYQPLYSGRIWHKVIFLSWV